MNVFITLCGNYGEDAAVFSLDPIDLIAGDLPRRQRRLFEAWAELHQSELLANWVLLQSGQVPLPIESLEGTTMIVHPICRVNSFAIVASYTLRVTFDDQTEQTINFEPVLAGDLYRPLRELPLFNQVAIDPEVRTLVWPNGADFDPATLHDWPRYVELLVARARQWELASV